MPAGKMLLLSNNSMDRSLPASPSPSFKTSSPGNLACNCLTGETASLLRLTVQRLQPLVADTASAAGSPRHGNTGADPLWLKLAGTLPREWSTLLTGNRSSLWIIESFGASKARSAMRQVGMLPSGDGILGYSPAKSIVSNSSKTSGLDLSFNLVMDSLSAKW